MILRISKEQRMREIFFKNITSLDHRRRAVSVSETVEEDGIFALTEKRCTYIIKNKVHLEDAKDVLDCVSQLQEEFSPKRQIFIRKEFNLNTQEKVFSCKIIGRFYIVAENDIYTIAFNHAFKIFIKEIK
jgi:hypothetical protein